MNISKIKIKTLILLLVLVITAITSLLALVQDYQQANINYEETINTKLNTVIQLAHNFIGKDFHDSLLDKDSLSTEEYAKIVDKFNQICLDLDLKFIWSILDINDTVVFTTTTSPDKITANHKQAKFFESPASAQLYREIIQSGTSRRLLISDDWGELESLIIPFKDSHGRTYLFAAALDSTLYRQELASKIYSSMLHNAFLIIPSMLICYIFITWLIHPLTYIISNIQKIAQGEYQDISHKWAEEYVKLAKSIHLMYSEINGTYLTIKMQEKDLKTTLMCIGEGVIVTDKQGNITRINQEASKLTGWQKDDASNQPLPKIFRLYDSMLGSYTPHPLHTALSEARPIPLSRSTMLLCRDNTEYHISGIVAPIISNKNITGTVVTFKNLTLEDKQAEKIRQNHEVMLSVLRLSKIAYWEYNVKDDTFWISKDIVSLYGITEVEEGIIDGKLLITKYFDTATDNTYDELNEAIENNQPFRSIHEVINQQNQQPLFFDAAATPIINAEGNVEKLIGLTKDITEHKILTHQLYHSQKLDAVGQLAGGIAHDFNNMLGGIIGFAELLNGELKGNEKLENYCSSIINTSENAARLTSQLLSFARKGKDISTPISVHRIINSAITLLERSIDKQITIIREFAAKVDTIIGDPAQLESVIINLGINARDAIPESGEIKITTELTELSPLFCKTNNYDIEPGNFIIIKIIDNGLGMNGKTLEHIFDPFFTTKGGKGTGLGLSIIHGIITSHGGVINVYSELGRGSEFKIYLPLNCELELDDIPTHGLSSDYSGSGLVLLIDDEAIIRSMGTALIEDLGYAVITAENGREGIELYKERQSEISVVLLDVVMPIMGGMECLQELIRINPKVKVIIASGFSKSDTSTDFINNGAFAFINKPYRQLTLGKKLKEAFKSE